MLVWPSLSDCPTALALEISPRQPVRLVLLGIGGVRGVRPDTETSLMILDFVDAMILDFFDDLGFPCPVRRPPLPIPFLVQPHMFQTPSLRTGGFFCGLPACPPFRRSALDPFILPAKPISHGLRAAAPHPTPPHSDAITALRPVAPA